jgi:hypothetical protein
MVPHAFYMIVFRDTVGLLWTSDQPVSETCTCTGQHNIETQETNIHALSGIRTSVPSNQAAADLRLRPRGYRSRRSISRNAHLPDLRPLYVSLNGCTNTYLIPQNGPLLQTKFTAVVSLRTVPLGACGNLFILFVVCLTTLFQ